MCVQTGAKDGVLQTRTGPSDIIAPGSATNLYLGMNRKKRNKRKAHKRADVLPLEREFAAAVTLGSEIVDDIAELEADVPFVRPKPAGASRAGTAASVGEEEDGEEKDGEEEDGEEKNAEKEDGEEGDGEKKHAEEQDVKAEDGAGGQETANAGGNAPDAAVAAADLGKAPEVWTPGDAEPVPDKAPNKLIGEWWEDGKPDDDDIKLVKVTFETTPNGLGGANSTTTTPPIFFCERRSDNSNSPGG